MPASTGLSQLGQALAQGSGDYANIQLQRQADERRRVQQLQDLQDARSYAEDRFNLERLLSLEDEARKRRQGVDDATINILLKEGWLSPTDVRDPIAVQAAADARQERIGSQLKREGELPARLQAEADYLGEQDVKLAEAEAALTEMLNSPQPSQPSQAEVMNLARQKTGKATPSVEEIEAQIPVALKEIEQERFQRWYMDKEDAKAQIPLLRNQRTVLRQSLSGLLQQGIVPSRNRPPAPLAQLENPVPARSAANPLESFTSVLEGQVPPAPQGEAASNYNYPALSVAGLGERAGITADAFSAERLGQAPMNILAAPGRMIDTAGRYGGALTRGLLVGDYSVPEKGVVTQAGEALGSLMAPKIAPGDYMSEARARLLNLPRSPDPLPKLPEYTPTSMFANGSMGGW